MRIGRRGLASGLAIVAGALLASGVSIAAGIAAVTRARAPEIALRAFPGDARALSAEAELLMTQQPTPAGAAAASKFASRAVARDPTLAAPYRVLGFAADLSGDRALALRYMTHAGRLSRRDLPGELWFIDYQVARGDVAGALDHFDAALRTSKTAPALLFPILAQAIGERPIVAALAARLATRPPWREAFLAEAIDFSPHLAGLTALTRDLARRRAPLDADRQRQLLGRLVAAKSFGLAAQVATTAGAKTGSLGRIDAADGVAPFAWTLADVSGGAIERAGGVLRFRFDDGGGGELARHLLALAPGRYALRYRGGSDAAARDAPVWSVVCGETGATIAQAAVGGPLNGAAGRVGFTVSATSCRGQWLILSAHSATGTGGTTGWVGPVDLVAG